MALAGLVAACGDDGGDAEQSADLTYEDVLAQAQQLAPPSQQEAISDGVVTFAEYEAAVFAAVECMRDAGLDISTEPHLVGGRRYDFGVQGAPVDDPERDNEVIEQIFACQDEHSSFIESVYFYEDPRTPEEEADRFEGFRSCATAATGMAYEDAIDPGEILQETFEAGVDTMLLADCLAQFDFG